MKKPEPAPKVTATKANIGKPASSNKMGYLGAAVQEVVKPGANMKGTKLSDLNFKVDPEFKTRFKITATAAGLSMKELLEEGFDLWIKDKRGRRELDL